PTAKSERVVVDEIFSDNTVRLLRAKRSKNSGPKDFSIDTWNSECETFMKAWQVAAFVGLPTQRKLREGDVFFVTDGSKLTTTYGTPLDKKRKKPIPREAAAREHLLSPIDKSRELARQEIKKEFYKLSACKMTSDKKEVEKLLKAVEDKFKDNAPVAIKKGGK
ncbi:MAG: hypothetical protein ACE5DO_14725, partial [Desulfobacterales bacterium]